MRLSVKLNYEFGITRLILKTLETFVIVFSLQANTAFSFIGRAPYLPRPSRFLRAISTVLLSTNFDTQDRVYPP